jgi:hypothetical protein
VSCSVRDVKDRTLSPSGHRLADVWSVPPALGLFQGILERSRLLATDPASPGGDGASAWVSHGKSVSTVADDDSVAGLLTMSKRWTGSLRLCKPLILLVKISLSQNVTECHRMSRNVTGESSPLDYTPHPYKMST